MSSESKSMLRNERARDTFAGPNQSKCKILFTPYTSPMTHVRFFNLLIFDNLPHITAVCLLVPSNMTLLIRPSFFFI